MAKEKTLPSTEQNVPKKPEKKMKEKEKPALGNPENVVVIGGTEVEIKPTKLKYHRNNVASFYKIIENVPLADIMTFPAGTFGDDRDGDKAVMDWLACVVDDMDLIYMNYDEMDTELVNRMLSIFKRVNRIDEREAAQKNALSREKTE